MNVQQVEEKYDSAVEAFLDEREGHEALLDELLRVVVREHLLAIEIDVVEYLANEMAEFPSDVIEAIHALVTATDFFDVLLEA